MKKEGRLSPNNFEGKQDAAIVCGDGFLGKSLLENSNFVRLKSVQNNYLKYGYRDNAKVDKQVFEMLKSSDVSLFVNASGASDVSGSFGNIDQYRNDPVNQVKHHLELLSSLNRDMTYVYLSSASVYGNQEVLPMAELSSCFPVSPYAEGKYLAELKIEELSSQFGIRSIVLRVFSAYSNLLEKQLPFLISKSLFENDNLELFGDGTELRDFIHVSDIAKVIQNSKRLLGQNQFSLFNLGTGSPITVNEVGVIALEKFNSMFPQKKKMISFNGIVREGDPRHMVADISKLKEKLEIEFLRPQDGLRNYFGFKFSELETQKLS
jgi:UDP-glucose 4-epimerase